MMDPLPPLAFVSTDHINQLPIAFAKNIARRSHLAATHPKDVLPYTPPMPPPLQFPSSSLNRDRSEDGGVTEIASSKRCGRLFR